MDFECKSLSDKALAREKCDGLLLVLGPQGDAGEGVLATLAKRAQSDEVLDSKAGACVLLYRAPEVAAVRTVLAQGGDGSARQVAKAVTAAAVQLKSGKPRKLVLAFAQQPTEDALRAALQALADALYVYTATKSKAEPSTVQRVLVALPEATPLKAAFRQAVATAAGVELAREWANRPANVATPTALASVAQALTELPKVQCEVLGPREVAKLGMGSFQAVAQGTEEELRFIVLRYNGAAKSAAPIVLVGKGITFDSGGISLKPGAEMDEMKFDMSGAASVLGVFRALAELQPKINVVGLIPACENLPSGRAIKPGDVVTTMSGQTVEITAVKEGGIDVKIVGTDLEAFIRSSPPAFCNAADPALLARILPGFDQDAFMAHAGFDDRSLASLLDEWDAVRRAEQVYGERDEATGTWMKLDARSLGLSSRELRAGNGNKKRGKLRLALASNSPKNCGNVAEVAFSAFKAAAR